MIKKIQMIIATIIISISGMSFVIPAVAHATNGTTSPTTPTTPVESATTASLCNGVTGNFSSVTSTPQTGKPNDCGAGAGNTVNSTLSLVLNLFSAIVGVIAVVMIIIGGVQYVTSGGSSEKTTKAKDTILFAIVGLIIVALAQIIVKFVLHKASTL